jgi:hypothetical protein
MDIVGNMSSFTPEEIVLMRNEKSRTIKALLLKYKCFSMLILTSLILINIIIFAFKTVLLDSSVLELLQQVVLELRSNSSKTLAGTIM